MAAVVPQHDPEPVPEVLADVLEEERADADAVAADERGSPVADRAPVERVAVIGASEARVERRSCGQSRTK